jgi:hypothetical protein
VSRILLTVLLAGISALGSAQTVAAPALKAAFLYNFAKFTEWPVDALGSGSPLGVCTTDAAVFDELVKITAGRSLGNHQVAARRVAAADESLRACHMLYVPEMDAKNTAQLLDALKGAPMLTVGDGEGFVKLGGVAGLFVENGQMRFAIGVESARRARLELSSKLLSLAKIIQE